MAKTPREINKVCRLCLSDDEGILFPTSKLIDSTLTVDDIERFTGVRIIEKERITYVVCIDCNNKLRKFNTFRSICLSNDVQFRKWFSTALEDEPGNTEQAPSSAASPIKQEFATCNNETGEQNDSIDEITDQTFIGKTEVSEIDVYDHRIDDASVEEDESSVEEDREQAPSRVRWQNRSTMAPPKRNIALPSKYQYRQAKQEERRFFAGKYKDVDEEPEERKLYVPQKQLCPLCGKLIHSLADHMLSHTKEPRFSCTYCPMKCSRKSYLKLHIDAVHMKRVIKTCEICNQGFSYIESYDAHLRSKHNIGESFECKICNLTFRHKGGLRGHNNRKHNEQTNCSCTICGMKFQDKRGLLAHGRVHSDEKPFACRFCPKRFKSPNAHRTHELIHKGVVFPCTMCDKTYTYKSLLNMHVKKCHTRQEESEHGEN